jgi:hypothetical protein
MISLRICIVFVAILLFCSLVSGNLVFAQPISNNTQYNFDTLPKQTVTNYYSNVTASPFWSAQTTNFPPTKPHFTLTPVYDDNGKVKSLVLALRPELKEFYQEVGLSKYKPQDTVFVYPIFTQAAYGQNGFYNYFKKKCDAVCLTVNIPTQIKGDFTSSIGAALVLTMLNYPHITDIDIDKNPDILKKYDRIILLHNEYVTYKEFQAITSHPNVVYLYPNALYAEVNANYDTNTISLVKGHGYPIPSIGNGFGWKYDDSRFEYDISCADWKFYKINNGIMMNCYPDYQILYDDSIVRALQGKDVGDMKNDINEWLGNSTESISNKELLGDAGIEAHFMPTWFIKLGYWFANEKITENEFVNSIKYLYEKNIIR